MWAPNAYTAFVRGPFPRLAAGSPNRCRSRSRDLSSARPKMPDRPDGSEFQPLKDRLDRGDRPEPAGRDGPKVEDPFPTTLHLALSGRGERRIELAQVFASPPPLLLLG